MSLPPQEKPRRSPHSRGTACDGSRATIVYIEDNPSNIALMSDLLAEFEPVELVTAPTAEIGIELVRARRPRVVIIDIDMPGMDARDAARRLRAWPETRAIPVIALGALGAAASAAATRHDTDFHVHLNKPLKVDDAIRALTEVLLPGTRAAT